MKIYEDNAKEKLSDERFPMMSGNYVGAPDKSSGKRQQKIEIYYDGAGFIPLNLLMQRETA